MRVGEAYRCMRRYDPPWGTSFEFNYDFLSFRCCEIKAFAGGRVTRRVYVFLRRLARRDPYSHRMTSR